MERYFDGFVVMPYFTKGRLGYSHFEKLVFDVLTMKNNMVSINHLVKPSDEDIVIIAKGVIPTLPGYTMAISRDDELLKKRGLDDFFSSFESYILDSDYEDEINHKDRVMRLLLRDSRRCGVKFLRDYCTHTRMTTDAIYVPKQNQLITIEDVRKQYFDFLDPIQVRLQKKIDENRDKSESETLNYFRKKFNNEYHTISLDDHIASLATVGADVYTDLLKNFPEIIKEEQQTRYSRN